MNLLVHVRTTLDNTDDKLFVQLYTGMDSMADNFSLIGRNMENQPTKCTIKFGPYCQCTIIGCFTLSP